MPKHESAYSKAASLGFPFIRGDGKARGNVWLNRFQKDGDTPYPAVYVGWDADAGKWIVEHDPPKPGG